MSAISHSAVVTKPNLESFYIYLTGSSENGMIWRSRPLPTIRRNAAFEMGRTRCVNAMCMQSLLRNFASFQILHRFALESRMAFADKRVGGRKQCDRDCTAVVGSARTDHMRLGLWTSTVRISSVVDFLGGPSPTQLTTGYVLQLDFRQSHSPLASRLDREAVCQGGREKFHDTCKWMLCPTLLRR